MYYSSCTCMDAMYVNQSYILHLLYLVIKKVSLILFIFFKDNNNESQHHGKSSKAQCFVAMYIKATLAQ